MDLYAGVGLKDPWKKLRENLYRNTEPKVKLIGITKPTIEMEKKGLTSNTLPAYTARHCWESANKYSEDAQKNQELDKQLVQRLIQMKHDTPLQAVNYVFDIEGVTKSLQAQWTRHKIGIGWSFRSTRFVSGASNTFVYNTYDYIEDEKKVEEKVSFAIKSTSFRTSLEL
jgi:thymidylate synthase ThyX